MKLLILFMLVIFPFQSLEDRTKSFRNHKRFSVNYDRFKDRTSVDAGPFLIGSIHSSEFSLTARLIFVGQKPDDHCRFVLWFQASGRDWELIKYRHLDALVDGERFDLGEGEHSGNVTSRYGGVVESLGFPIASEVFQKIGKARSVELKIGITEITLKDEHKEAFRDLYSLSKP